MSNRKKRQEEALKKAKKKRVTIIVYSAAAIVIIAAITLGIIGYNNMYNFKAVRDYSIELENDGTIKGIDVNKYVNLCDVTAMEKTLQDFYPSDETVDEHIKSVCESCSYVDDTENVTLKTGDEANIDYDIIVDGEKYADGSTGGKGTVVTVGAGEFPGDFDKKLAGHKTGENFQVEIIFAEDFNNEVLAGKTTTFDVTVNGIYVEPEFDDAFVKKYFPNFAGADDYTTKYKDSVANVAYADYIMEYLVDESEVTKYPSKYKKQMMKLYKGKDAMALEATGNIKEATNEDLLQNKNMDEKEYTEYLAGEAEVDVKDALVMQALYEKYNLSITQEDYNTILSAYGYEEGDMNKLYARFGEPYVNRMAIKNAVRRYFLSK